ncbi:MAG: P63C domain-containing protein [Acidobacteriia bacterium]|nr:P63C domain-containing protein [Terriglobia bacterium]
MTDNTHSPVHEQAKELSKLGASKGGRARANVLTPQERKEIAGAAVAARWKKAKGEAYEPPKTSAAETSPGLTPATGRSDLPHSMFRGKLTLGNNEVEVHVLHDLRRVFTQREFVRVLTGGTDTSNLGRYLERNPLVAKELPGGPEAIPFRVPGVPQTAHGYEATTLVEICSLYSEAREAGLLKGGQLRLARQAEIILRACAKVGIIALIDEATGYEKVRSQRALQVKLQAFIADELQEWARMFPEEFWLELARMEGVHYSPRSRPLRWGKYVMAFVYDAIDRDVGKKLREMNPNPHYKMNHHQLLRDFGKEQVNNQLQRVIAVMKLCGNMEQFKQKFARVFRKSGYQLSFDDIDWTLPS